MPRSHPRPVPASLRMDPTTFWRTDDASTNPITRSGQEAVSLEMGLEEGINRNEQTNQQKMENLSQNTQKRACCRHKMHEYQ